MTVISKLKPSSSKMSDQKMLQGLFIYCKDIEEWPSRWRESDEDLDCGQKILEQMIPFAASLIEKKLARSTIRKYLDNLFLLGREIIREVNFKEIQRKWPANSFWSTSMSAEGRVPTTGVTAVSPNPGTSISTIQFAACFISTLSVKRPTDFR
jgi:hypothetical protein